MIEGYTPVAVEHFGGLVSCWAPEMLDPSLLAEAQNLRFTMSAVCSRQGLTRAFAAPGRNAIGGLLGYVQTDGTQLPLVLGQDPNGDNALALLAESPEGSGMLVQQPAGSDRQFPVGARLDGASAFTRAYFALSDGRFGLTTPTPQPPQSFDGTNLDPVTPAGPASSPTAADSGTAGNVAAGTRYGCVMYKTREGSLTPAGGAFNWTAAGDKEVAMSNLPIAASAQVVARVVAFTVAGGSSDGPFYYIEEAQTVNGVNETATVVADNTSTTATFNFDDNFLASSLDCDNQFRSVPLNPQAACFFSQTTQRLMWWGDSTQPTVVMCSVADDAANYYGDTGFFEPSAGSGERVTRVFEWNNQLYCATDKSLYAVTPNNGDPATWDINYVAQQTGAAGVRALDVGPEFTFLVHRTGAYTFTGGLPTLVSDELLGAQEGRPGIWERINWACDYLIWVAIDAEEKCVRIGVPLDGSTACSHVLKVSYLDGWDRVIRFSAFTGRYHFFPGRRWSLDTIAASHGLRVYRPAAVGAFAGDRRVGESQTLLASSNADGTVSYVDASATTDNGAAIPWAMRFGGFSAAEQLKQMRVGVETMGLVQLRARGAGQIRIEAVVDGAAPVEIARRNLADPEAGDISLLALATGENVGLRLTPGDGASSIALMALYAYCRPAWTLRANLPAAGQP